MVNTSHRTRTIWATAREIYPIPVHQLNSVYWRVTAADKSRTRLFMFCLAPSATATADTHDTFAPKQQQRQQFKCACELWYFLCEQYSETKCEIKNGFEPSGTAKRVIWLSICTYLVFACFASIFCCSLFLLLLLQQFHNSFARSQSCHMVFCITHSVHLH